MTMMMMMMMMGMILIADYSQGEHPGSDPGLPGGHHPINMELLLLQEGDLIIIVDIVNEQTWPFLQQLQEFWTLVFCVIG